MPVPKPLESYSVDSDSESEEVSPEGTGLSTKPEPDFSTRNTSESHLITQAELKKLVQDLDLSKTKTQLFGSLLQMWNLLKIIVTT
jgi:hypothetical protein